jgi:hypothetical protein
MEPIESRRIVWAVIGAGAMIASSICFVGTALATNPGSLNFLAGLFLVVSFLAIGIAVIELISPALQTLDGWFKNEDPLRPEDDGEKPRRT